VRDAAAIAAAGAASSSVLTLLNLNRALPQTALGRLARVLSRLDNLSHVLLWSASVGAPGDECALTLVELPRLRASFSIKRTDDGALLLSSNDHDGLFVAEDPPANIRAHMRGVPHALILQNSNYEFFMMVPSYGLQRPEVRSCPFSSELVLERSREAWARHVKSHVYVYPVHMSAAFCSPPSLGSAFYLCVLRLLAREYALASRLVTACVTDVPFSAEERFLFGMVKRSEKDAHPDAHAVRLRLALVCFECGEKPAWDVNKDYQAYLKKYAHVSAECRLDADDEDQLLSRSRDEVRCMFLSAASEVHARAKRAEEDAAAAVGASSSGAASSAIDAAAAAAAVPLSVSMPGVERTQFGGGVIISTYNTSAFMHKNFKEVLKACASGSPADVVSTGLAFCYDRPEAVGTARAALDLMDVLWEDSFMGRRQKLGGMLIYEMATGAVQVRSFWNKIVVARRASRTKGVALLARYVPRFAV
jgi:hypothetical protein